MIIIGSVVVVGLLAGGIFAFSRSNNSKLDNIDVIGDYTIYKSALLKFRKSEKRKCENLKDLVKYIETDKELPYERYNITVDEKYFVVKNTKNLDVASIIKRIGGTSYQNGNKLYLSFLSLTKVSKIEPVASFKVIPSENIFTTTNIEYDTSGVVAEDGKVADYKWEGNEVRFSEEGTYIVRLKIKDINGNWSDWYEKELLVQEKKGLKSVSCGYECAYIVHENGKVDVLGRNELGQLGTGTNESLSKRTYAINLDNVESLSAGEEHAVFKTYNGKIFSIGSNKKGQLGLGTKINSKIPKEIWGLEHIKQVESGKSFSGALSVSGSVYTWGDNDYGQLGNEKNLMRNIPKKIELLSNIKQISFGNKHALALTYDGMVYSWGSNENGQLGVGFKGKSLEPTLSEFKNAKFVCAGKDASYVINEVGRVLVCGRNTSNQLGIVGEKEIVFPIENMNLKNIVYISSVGDFAVALDNIGKVYSWGRYKHSDEDYNQKPSLIDGVKYTKSISTTVDSVFIINEKNNVYTWSSVLEKRDKLELIIEDDEL
ncbi:RCC1 domain-containing protein [Helicovermis profundi]